MKTKQNDTANDYVHLHKFKLKNVRFFIGNSRKVSKSQKKISQFFFEISFEVSDKSHSAEKCKRGDPLGFFEHPFCCKIDKN